MSRPADSAQRNPICVQPAPRTGYTPVWCGSDVVQKETEIHGVRTHLLSTQMLGVLIKTLFYELTLFPRFLLLVTSSPPVCLPVHPPT
ncbi:hypothetical protein GN956_G18248 [Arapaima gigas]